MRAMWWSCDIHSNEVEVLPHFLQEVVKVPLVVGGDWNSVGNAINDIKLFYRDLVDFVENVYAGDVDPVGRVKVLLTRVADSSPVPLHHVNQVVRGGITAQCDICIVYFVL